MHRHITRSTALLSTVLCMLMVLVATAQSALAVVHDTIEGSGSSWAANAVTQWVADVTSSGLKVVYTAPGSAMGRKDFANNTTDFAISDIGFRGVDPATGDQDTNMGRPYAYLPIAAGGTSFPYNLSVGGKRVTNLRLSGLTLAKIFTNQIKSWDDAAITADNNGRKLPRIPIVPLVHSEGSGSTAQLTTFFDAVYPSIWRPFNHGRAGFTEYYPKQGNQIAQNGSDQIINYATSKAANGVITYEEYSYALTKKFPVVKVKNAAGYYNLPDQYKVAVALTKAKINTDTTSANYLLQDLSGVFGDTDPRTYPLSSYSYMIIPTGAADPRMSTAKRQTLVDFLYYSVCSGQKELGPIGYSPLPINLVQASFDQTNKLKTADLNDVRRKVAPVDITKRDVSTCHNPTFIAGQPTRNFLAEIAAQPPACDKAGAGPCTGAAAVGILGNPQGGKAPAGATGTGTSAGGKSAAAAGGKSATAAGGGSATAAGGGSAAAAGGGSAALPGSATATAAAAGAKIDPTTGEVLASGGLGASSSGVDGNQVAVPTDLVASSAVSNSILGWLAVVLLLLAIAMPPLIGRVASTRTSSR